MGYRALPFMAVFCCLSSVGCVPSLANRVPNSPIVMSRMAIMPVFATSGELDASDNAESDTEYTTDLFNSINPEVRRQAMKKGAHPFPSDWQAKCGEPCVRLYFRLVRWGSTSSLQIAAQMKGIRNYGAHSIAEWKLPLDFKPLREATGADYVLFVRIQDLRESTGRKVANAFTASYTMFTKEAVACVADLARREMIWCHAGSVAWTDLRNQQEASRVVQDLFSDLTP